MKRSELLLALALCSGFTQHGFAAQEVPRLERYLDFSAKECCCIIVCAVGLSYLMSQHFPTEQNNPIAKIGSATEYNAALNNPYYKSLAAEYATLKKENQMLRDEKENTYKQFMGCRTELLEAKLKAMSGETKKKK